MEQFNILQLQINLFDGLDTFYKLETINKINLDSIIGSNVSVNEYILREVNSYEKHKKECLTDLNIKSWSHSSLKFYKFINIVMHIVETIQSEVLKSKAV